VARRPRGPSITQTIGGVLVGFDEQVLRRRPPAQERVEQVDRALTVAAPNGIIVALPAPLGPPEPASDATRTTPWGPEATTAADAAPEEAP